MSQDNGAQVSRRGFILRLLDGVEWMGNKLPDPAILFAIGIGIVWLLSWWLAQMSFAEIDPRIPGNATPVVIKDLLNLPQFAKLLTEMVNQFVTFAPLGVVLVALLGVGVAEHAGFINAVLKGMLDLTPKALLTPMVILVAVISHTAADAGYVLVIPLAGLMFYGAGRHPLAGIAAAFAGVSGGFSANFVPSGIDPLLAGMTMESARIINIDYEVNPLCNWYFTAVSSFLIIAVGWFITDQIIEPKLKTTPVDGDLKAIAKIDALSPRDRTAMYCGLASMVVGLLLLAVWAYPENSSLRDGLGSLTSLSNKTTRLGFEFAATEDGVAVTEVVPKGAAATAGLQVDDRISKIGGKPVEDFEGFKKTITRLPPDRPVLLEYVRGEEAISAIYVPKSIPGAPLVNSIVPLIFLLFVIPGIIHGYVSGNFKSHRDVVKGMSKAMESMAYYLVLVFFAALFIYVFKESDLGVLLAVKGANALRGQPIWVIILGIIGLTAGVNLLVGSASAKWAMLGPIFVPMLMMLNVSPEFAQAAYRVGDSTTNIITPMMPYFPLVVVFAQRYYTKAGIGTLVSMMLPYSIAFIILWSLFLLLYWQTGLPLGIQGGYAYPPVGLPDGIQ